MVRGVPALPTTWVGGAYLLGSYSSNKGSLKTTSGVLGELATQAKGTYQALEIGTSLAALQVGSAGTPGLAGDLPPGDSTCL